MVRFGDVWQNGASYRVGLELVAAEGGLSRTPVGGEVLEHSRVMSESCHYPHFVNLSMFLAKLAVSIIRSYSSLKSHSQHGLDEETHAAGKKTLEN